MGDGMPGGKWGAIILMLAALIIAFHFWKVAGIG